MNLNNPEEFRCGFAAVAGRPNVGKSTLINALLGQKIAAVSPKPQTTRVNQLGILTNDEAQVVFVDTPGLHLPHNKLGEGMNAVAAQALSDADVVLWLVDANQPPHEEDQIITARLAEMTELPPVLQILNKTDLINEDVLAERCVEYARLFPKITQISVSALTGKGLPELLAAVTALLPQGEALFPDDQITDLYERDIAADLIREAALEHLREEVPYALAVRIDDYQERGEEGAFISATLFVEKDSQKGIVIGKGGLMLKEIGKSSRAAIEKMSGRKVYLELRVKVSKNWRSNPAFLKQMGYTDLNEDS
ncbi:GTPase Era [Pelolinea submarina]|uniref:GTPase Era n=1 Tax=Pelolinea submarina TaxID=913107 RepID=A0A347ZQB6_9CHLR|nr:GTPase Era [Pelolinea submarina]REG06173.1 GTP-binding protein Era [Pelolinea submarina]BBB47497.1 GTPase [Pelolinea submarina]